MAAEQIETLGSGEERTRGEILARLKELEDRISRVETHLDLPPLQEAGGRPSSPNAEEREEALELQIGQNWFAKAGIVGIALGIAFLLTFPYQDIPPYVPSLVGYLLTGVLFVLSHLWRKSYEQVSRYLLGGGLLLLYFTTLRLSRFSPHPALTDESLEAGILAVVVVFILVVSFRRVSPYLASLGILLGIVTALLQGDAYVVGISLCLIAAVTSHGYRHHGWLGVLAFGTLAVYLGDLVWALNDPLRGTTLRLVGGPEPTVIFPILSLVILAYGALTRRKDDVADSYGGAAAALVNAGGSFLLVLVLTALALKSHIAAWHAGLSLVALVIAIGFWTMRKSTYSTFVYAMLGYLALSVAIIDMFPKPDSLVWLCWESLLVIITAIWFRSRFIIVANFVIYATVFIAYLLSSAGVTLISISFGLVALLSARILNWKKERLELKTELMRNAYLGSALFFIPYALYHSVPPGFVSISWLTTALIYYLASRLLKSRKYRWMALLTTIMTILYVFIIDLVQVNPAFRIVSFLVLGSALLLTSMIYTRRRLKERKEDRKAREPAP